MENENSKLLHVFIAGLREYPTAGIIARTVPRTDRTCQAFYLVAWQCVQNAVRRFLGSLPRALATLAVLGGGGNTAVEARLTPALLNLVPRTLLLVIP